VRLTQAPLRNQAGNVERAALGLLERNQVGWGTWATLICDWTARNDTEMARKTNRSREILVGGLDDLWLETAWLRLRKRCKMQLGCRGTSGTQFSTLGTMLDSASELVRLREREIGAERDL